MLNHLFESTHITPLCLGLRGGGLASLVLHTHATYMPCLTHFAGVFEVLSILEVSQINQQVLYLLVNFISDDVIAVPVEPEALSHHQYVCLH